MTKTTFKQADVERAIRSARASGMKVETIEVVTPDGVTIRVSGEKKCNVNRGDEAPTESSNEWDEALKRCDKH
jgi:hypothetical protein